MSDSVKKYYENRQTFVEQDIEFLRVQNEFLKEQLAKTLNQLTLLKGQIEQQKRILNDYENRIK